ncbi:MAG: hypothetical protein BMS9Abin02_1875 [Anaerolineae bacterium]|nr:MAG: hypothetical protein BMS9Abin02_1875 [Anaerolineae bacterium]
MDKRDLDLGFTYILQGRELYDPEDLMDRIIADYKRTLTLKPDDHTTYFRRADAYLDLSDADRAIADFDRANQLYPDFAAYYYKRGLAYRLNLDRDRAIADFHDVVRLSGDADFRQLAKDQLEHLDATL